MGVRLKEIDDAYRTLTVVSMNDPKDRRTLQVRFRTKDINWLRACLKGRVELVGVRVAVLCENGDAAPGSALMKGGRHNLWLTLQGKNFRVLAIARLCVKRRLSKS